MKDEQANLEERARQAQTFDEKWGNIINTLKATLLPLIEALDEVIGPALDSFINWFQSEKIGKSMSDLAKKIGGWIKGLAEFIQENPIKSIIAGIAGLGLF
nr:hypothetical protein [Candidatus Dadabacteria bacterium]